MTDINGCTQTASAVVNSSPNPTITVNAINVSCHGGNNGSANAVVTNGTAPYIYSWSNSQTNSIATNLSVGTYTVFVTDSNGCSSLQIILITEPPAITISFNSTPTLLFNWNRNGNSKYCRRNLTLYLSME